MKRARVLAALALLAAAAAAVVVVSGGSPIPAEPSSSRMPTSEDCARCHAEIAAEVRESMHGRAFRDPEVLRLSEDFAKGECVSCHAPQPLFITGVGERVFARRERRGEGVDCISCHLREDGTVAGTRGLAAPCRPVKDERLKTATFCVGCHNQHWTVDEFMASRWAETSTCNTCHMPAVRRRIADDRPDRPVREGVRTHRFEGGHSLEMLRKGVTLRAAVEGREVVMRVTNSGTGHKLPTDSRHRSFNLVLSVVDEDGARVVDLREIAEYRLYYRQQKIEPTQIPPDATRTHRFRLPAETAHGKVIVELYYCLKPPEKVLRTWRRVHRVELAF